MDFNIASAFWFASSGKGWLYDPPPQQLLPPLSQKGALGGGVGGVGVVGNDVVGVVGDGVGSVSEDGVGGGDGGNGGGKGGGGDDGGKGGGGDDVEDNGPNIEARGALACKVSATNGLPSTPAPDVLLTTWGMSSAEPTYSFAAVTLKPESRGGTTRLPSASASSGDRAGNGARGTDKGKVANRATKVNKNMDELCPVKGCRRLLKPGCVFGVCSRCCLKAQGLIDVAASTPDASVSERVPPSVAVVAATAAAAAAAATVSGAAGVAAVNESEAQRLLCKARAVEEASQALKGHLTEHFDELSEPFKAEALAAILLKRSDWTCQVRPGRNVHFQALALASGARQSIKWCPVHKRRSRGGQVDGGDDRHATAARAKSGVEAGGLEKRSMSAAMYTSAARVLLVRWQPGRFLALCHMYVDF